MTRRWRIGVMGLGHWYSGVRLAQAMPQYDKAELVAVASLDETKAHAFGDMFGVPSYTNYDEFLSETDVDMVHIAPPPSEMRDCAVKAAQAGKQWMYMAVALYLVMAAVAFIQRAKTGL